MGYSSWEPGLSIESPVYLDANVLVGAVVTKHRLYGSSVQLIGDLLANQSSILVSILAFQESLWALARISYCDLFNQPSRANFSLKTYERRCGEIFAAYGERMGAVGSMLNAWSEAGVSVEVVPKTGSSFSTVSSLTPRYMSEFSLAPADAVHLAVAGLHAKTFVTADADFEEAAASPTLSGLSVLHLAASA